MAFILKLLGRNKETPQSIYLRGMDAFSAKKLQQALVYFEEASRKTREYSVKVASLQNMGTIYENTGNRQEASNYFFRTAILKAKNRQPHKEIVDSLTKAYRLRSKTDTGNVGEIVAPLMLYAIAIQDFSLAEKGFSRISDLPKNPLVDFAIKAWELAKNRKTASTGFEQKLISSLPPGFPKDMSYVVNDASNVIRAYSVVEATLAFSAGKRVKAGDALETLLIITTHSSVEITGVTLTVGSKGIITHTPLEVNSSFKLAESEQKTLKFLVEPQLNGLWEIGPAAVNYKSGEFQFPVLTDVITVIVEQAAPTLEIALSHAIVEEDFEFEISSLLTNVGKVVVEDLKVRLIPPPPEIAKITTGSSEKLILSLVPGEKFEFSNNIRFESGIIGRQHKIRLIATFQDQSVEKELTIDGVLGPS